MTTEKEKFSLEAENKMIEQKQKESQDDPFSVAAMMFGLYHPKFTQMVDTLSTRETKRLINALVTYPLNDKLFVVEDSSEMLRNAFHVGNSLMEAKTLMLIHSLNEKEKVSKNSVDTEVKEEANGKEEADVR